MPFVVKVVLDCLSKVFEQKYCVGGFFLFVILFWFLFSCLFCISFGGGFEVARFGFDFGLVFLLCSLSSAEQSIFHHSLLHLEHNISSDLLVINDTSVTILLQHFFKGEKIVNLSSFIERGEPSLRST